MVEKYFRVCTRRRIKIGLIFELLAIGFSNNMCGFKGVLVSVKDQYQIVAIDKHGFKISTWCFHLAPQVVKDFVWSYENLRELGVLRPIFFFIYWSPFHIHSTWGNWEVKTWIEFNFLIKYVHLYLRTWISWIKCFREKDCR